MIRRALIVGVLIAALVVWALGVSWPWPWWLPFVLLLGWWLALFIRVRRKA